ncbi:FAD-dependent oxidoreductase [Halioxenophilus aromaticivorans]|uniref:Bifunctional TVP38/TMEM64 family protein/FAD-dependent oxidoreductase n=1 Tax=Halioxenophilus aromaticivorans TaxID=1306992 RepID=A0AAV3U8L0_9ALTE
MKKIAVLMILALCVVAFFVFDLASLLTLEQLKASMSRFSQWRDANPILVSAAFFVLYVAVTALSLPGAAVMTLAAGALFGLLWGVILVSFASSLGATLAFLVARYLLGDSVQKKFGDRLKTINDGVRKDGAFYLFTLRLVPIFPFFLINLLMALTPIRSTTFYWVSQVGMLAGTAVFVNAGTQLAKLDSLVGILSPALLLSFVLLGVFPWVAKTVISVIKRKRVYAGYSKPKRFDRNMVVIGAGAGGLVTSYIAAVVGAKVTLVEAHKMGGDCLNTGCVPSKALIKSAKVAKLMRSAENYGLENLSGLENHSAQFSMAKIMARVNEVIKTIEPHDSIERYTNLGVEVIEGYAKIIDPWTVEIARNDGQTQTLTTRSIVLATGAEPVVPPLPGIEEVGYLTSDNLWQTLSSLPTVPKRLVVLGGGPIGCELTQSFARLGSQVTQVEMGDRIMAREDGDVSDFVKARLEADGVTVLTGHKALRCEINGDEKSIIVEHQGQEVRISFDYLLCAVGRKARLTGYGLEDLAIPVDRTITTNEYLETLYPNIFAAGDVAGPYQFTHTASHQAWYAAVNALFGNVKKFKADYRVIPWTTFTEPEVARVGLNEQEAIAAGTDYDVTVYGIDDLDRAIAESEAAGFVKLLTVPGSDKILGVTIVGEHAGELLAEYVLAMKHGLGVNKVFSTIHTYPTWSEANKFVAGQWKQASAPTHLQPWLKKYHAWRRGASNEN